MSGKGLYINDIRFFILFIFLGTRNKVLLTFPRLSDSDFLKDVLSIFMLYVIL